MYEELSYDGAVECSLNHSQNLLLLHLLSSFFLVDSEYSATTYSKPVISKRVKQAGVILQRRAG
jgi:hypothetical protein